MASADTLSSFRDTLIGFTDAVEQLLRKITQATSTDDWARHTLTALDEVWIKCFELGVTSIKTAHEVIAFFSGSEKTGVDGIRALHQSAATAIEATRTRCTELQSAVENAWKARRSAILAKGNRNYGFELRGLSMDVIDEYFGAIEDGKVPSLESRVTELGRLWGSFDVPREIEITASISGIVALSQQHILRVCLYGLPLKTRYESASSGTFDSPFLDHLFRNHILGKEYYVGVLARYSREFDKWESDELTELFDKDIIGSLSYLQSHDFSDLPEEALSSLMKLLQLFAKAFASSLSALSSTWAVEQCYYQLKTLDIFPLDQDQFAALQTMPAHQEKVQEAITNAHTEVDAIIHLLEQFLENRVFIDYNPSADINDDPKCIECELAELLTYSEEVLLDVLRYRWEWAISKPASDENEKNVINDFHDVVICDRPYAPSLHPQHFVDPDPKLSTISQIPPPQINPAFDLENPQLFWSQVLTITTNLRKHLPLKGLKRKTRPAPPKPLHRWRPCSCKEQRKFAAESEKTKQDLSKTTAPRTSDPLSRKVPPSTPSTQGAGTTQKGSGTSSLQGDWSF